MTRLFSICSILALVTASLASHIDISETKYTGTAFWAAQGTGACGIHTTDKDYVTGISEAFWDKHGGQALCGRYITATYHDKTVTVKVTDVDLRGTHDLGLSKAAFNTLDNIVDGEISPVTWVLDPVDPKGWRLMKQFFSSLNIY